MFLPPLDPLDPQTVHVGVSCLHPATALVLGCFCSSSPDEVSGTPGGNFIRLDEVEGQSSCHQPQISQAPGGQQLINRCFRSLLVLVRPNSLDLFFFILLSINQSNFINIAPSNHKLRSGVSLSPLRWFVASVTENLFDLLYLTRKRVFIYTPEQQAPPPLRFLIMLPAGGSAWRWSYNLQLQWSHFMLFSKDTAPPPPGFKPSAPPILLL